MPSIQSQIKAVGRECGTAYTISQIVGAETDPTNAERWKCERRWQRWLKGEGLKTLALLEQDLAHLGYRITITRT